MSVRSEQCLIGFLGADWWGSDARATASELRRQGHLLVERHYEDHFPTRWRLLALRLMRKITRPLMASDYNRAVRDLLSIDQLSFLLVFKGMLLDAATLRQFKDKGVPCYCLYPDVSFRDHGRNIWDCLPLYDIVFTTKPFHFQDSEVLKRVKKLVLVPHGFDPDVHRSVTVGTSLSASYGCDVSFVGAWSPKKEQTLTALASQIPNIDLRIWGPSWNHASASLQKFWQGRGAWGDELAAICACSKINLGLLSEAGRNAVAGDTTTARTWQIPACGGFLLHEDTPDLRSCFEPDKHVGVFDQVDRIGDVVRYWLDHPEEREAARVAAKQHCEDSLFTYRRAVDTILSYYRKSAESSPSLRGGEGNS